MSNQKDTSVTRSIPDSLGLLRQMGAEFDRVFDQPFWGAFRRPLQSLAAHRLTNWSPGIDVFEKDHRLITKVDLPGMKKNDVKVEVTDGQLVISGERKSETEETKDNIYRCEREYGSFYRTIPVPKGVRLEEISAAFADGVLEVSMPLPVTPEPKAHKVDIQEAKPVTPAA